MDFSAQLAGHINIAERQLGGMDTDAIRLKHGPGGFGLVHVFALQRFRIQHLGPLAERLVEKFRFGF